MLLILFKAFHHLNALLHSPAISLFVSTRIIIENILYLKTIWFYMKKTNILIISALLSLLFVGVFFVFLISLRKIESQIFALISVYGYFAILVTAFIVDVLVQPIGPEIPLIAARTMGLGMVVATLATIIGSISASFFSYKVGKTFYPKLSKNKKYIRYSNLYKKHGKYALLIAALGPVPYVPFCWFSGTFALPIKDFVLFGIIPRIIRIIFVSYILILFL